MRIIIEKADSDDFNELAKLARAGKIHTFCMTDEEEWISVSKRLPDKEGKCLVFTDYGDVTMDSYRDGMFVCNLGNVTHWRPLPQKPNESEDK